MSEYQYYEFRTIDQPLTPEQLSYVRGLSTRAEITPTHFTNTYNYGDFGGNPRRLMKDYYDAHVYVSNFGSLHFMLRLPQNVIPEETLKRYASEEALEWWTTEKHMILDWMLNEDGGSGDWMEGDGWLDRLLPIRDELVRGDYRSLYIGWLASFAGGVPSDDEEDEDGDDETDEYDDEADKYDDEYDEDEYEDEDSEDEEERGRSGRGTKLKEPPVPPGLKSLTSAQASLAEFLGVSQDLISAAATESPAMSSDSDTSKKGTEWVAALPEKEVRALLERILAGEALQVQTDLQGRFYRTLGEATKGAAPKSGGRTAAELLALADQMESERKKREAEAKEKKHRAHLASLVPRFAELWTQVNDWAGEQTGSSYDKASTQLVDLRAAYGQAGRRPEFDREFAQFWEKYSRSAALARRLKAAKLIP